MSASSYSVACIETAVAFLGEQIRAGDIPSLEECARASNLSKFHFHRLFRLVTGETFAQMTTRLRLARGASALDDRPGAVTDAAFAAGYSSSQAFAKAVKRESGLTASDLSADPDRLTRALQIFSAVDGPRDLTVELVSLDPFTVIAKRTEGLYPNLNATYFDLFGAIENPKDVRAILGRPLGDIEDDGLVFDCALLLNAQPSDLQDDIALQAIDGGSHLRVRHVGGYDGLSDRLDDAYALLLSDAGLAPADQPCLFHYLDDPETVAEDDLRTDMYLPVIQTGA